jgi:hypothetical protein
MFNSLAMHFWSVEKMRQCQFRSWLLLSKRHAKSENISMQGFKCCDEFFAVTILMFNASKFQMQIRYCHWDAKSIAISESDIPSELILRQVDNVPVVSPEGTNWGGEKISIISRKLLIANVNWLKSCPKKTKRKSLRQPGEWWCPSFLLGSTDLIWAIPESK